jgi:DNA-binding LacI/PurR family transcriptional regulator
VSRDPTRVAGLIGMLLPSVIRARFPELIGGAEEIIRQAGYSLVLGTSGDDRSLEAEQLQRMLDRGVSGLIVYAVDGPLEVPALRQLFDRGFPLVLIDRYFPDLAVDTVTMDNIGGGFIAVQHLVEQGYRRIGYIGTDNLRTSSIVERLAGYRWALDACELQLELDLICTALRPTPWPVRDAELERHNQSALRAYLDRPERPEAVFACNDYVAFQVVQACEGLGLRIPDDLGIVGFDNVSYAEYFGVPLTTVEQEFEELGATAASFVLDRINGQRTRLGRFVISTRLILRRSSSRDPASREAAMDGAMPLRSRLFEGDDLRAQY